MPTSNHPKQLGLWPNIGHRNHYLFSDYFLNERLHELAEWQNPAELSTVFIKLTDIWEQVSSFLVGSKEAQTRKLIIDPVLELLGHVYEPAPSLPTGHSVKEPDYGIFPSKDALEHAIKKRGQLDYFKYTTLVAEAKRYGRPLNEKSHEGSDPFDNNNPNYQIDY